MEREGGGKDGLYRSDEKTREEDESERERAERVGK